MFFSIFKWSAFGIIYWRRRWFTSSRKKGLRLRSACLLPWWAIVVGQSWDKKMVLGVGVNWDRISKGILGGEVTYMHELLHIVLSYMVYTPQLLIIIRHLLKVTYACLVSRNNKGIDNTHPFGNRIPCKSHSHPQFSVHSHKHYQPLQGNIY